MKMRMICSAANFYPRSPCGERRITGYLFDTMQVISIHALLAESDSMMPLMAAIPILFLSTLSLRRATLLSTQNIHNFVISIHALLAESDQFKSHFSLPFKDFYPRSPCGERLMKLLRRVMLTLFLSTLSLRRATNYHLQTERRNMGFLSTLSLRRATYVSYN